MRNLARLLSALGVALFASTLCASASAQPRAPRTVLVVHWGPEEFPATPVVNAALRKALTSDSHLAIELFTEYLESDLFSGEQASTALADYIRRKYRGRRIDLVIAIADPALQFVLDHRQELFPGAPIVYSGVGMPATISRSAGGGLTAVMRGVAYAETLKLALELHPLTEQVFVVVKGPRPAARGLGASRAPGFFATRSTHVSQRGHGGSAAGRRQGRAPAKSDSVYLALSAGSRVRHVCRRGRAPGGPGLGRAGLRHERRLHRFGCRRRRRARHGRDGHPRR